MEELSFSKRMPVLIPSINCATPTSRSTPLTVEIASLDSMMVCLLLLFLVACSASNQDGGTQGTPGPTVSAIDGVRDANVINDLANPVPVPVPASPALASSDAGIGSSKTGGSKTGAGQQSALGLYLGWDFAPCILTRARVDSDEGVGPCYESIADVLKAVPDLETRVRKNSRAMLEFAAALQWQEEKKYARTDADYWGRGVTVANQAMAKKTIASWFDASEEMKKDKWWFDTKATAVPLSQLSEPTWEGHTFVSYSIRKRSMDERPRRLDVLGLRYEVDFEKGIATHTALVSKAHSLKESRGNVLSHFGGPVKAFVSVKISDKSRVLIAKDAGKRAAKFLYQGPGGVQTRFPSWQALAKTIPEANSMATLSALVREVGGCNLIVDAAQYKKKYKKESWGAFKLKFWHDELRVTEFSVPKFDTISNPSLIGETLVVFCEGQYHQPIHVEIDLKNLSLTAAPSYTEMATSQIVSDTTKPGMGPNELNPRQDPRRLERIEPKPPGPAKKRKKK